MTREAATERAQLWLDGQDGPALIISDWVVTEFAAARFAEQYALGLRAGNALHVAVASDRGARICTLDKRLAEVALALGVDAVLV